MFHRNSPSVAAAPYVIPCITVDGGFSLVI